MIYPHHSDAHDRFEDYHTKNRNVLVVFILVLIASVIAGASYYYYTMKNDGDFTTTNAITMVRPVVPAPTVAPGDSVIPDIPAINRPKR